MKTSRDGIDRDHEWWTDPSTFPAGTELAGDPAGNDGVWTQTPDGRKEGRYTHFFDSGAKAGEHFYANDKRHGPSVSWYPSGQIEVAGSYLNNQPDGAWTFFTSEGQIDHVEQYRVGRKVITPGEAAARQEERTAALERLRSAASAKGEDGVVATLLADIVVWFESEAAPCFEAFCSYASPIAADEIAGLETHLGRPLPGAFRAYLMLAHGYYRFTFYEYSSLDLTHIQREASQIAQPGWIPFAEDGCGNLLALAPDNQVCFRDTSGEVIATSPGFLEYLEAYQTRLASGTIVYDVDSGIFDQV